MERAATAAASQTGAGYPDLPVRSPWIAQLAPLGDPRPPDADIATDVAIIGAGIAGIATAFFALLAPAAMVAGAFKPLTL